MAVNLSFIGGAGWQFFDNNGNPLSGGKIYTYAAGTTTPLATFTSRTGLTPNTNPIILDSAGRTPQQIWSTEGLLYKYEVMTSNDVLIRSWDNIGGSVVASDLAQDLANNTDPTKGDALIGFRQSNSSGNLTGAAGKTVHVKLQEYVSVKDFGAVGNGIADDTVAIQTAFNSGATSILIPDGDYVIDNSVNPLTLSNSGITVEGTGRLLFSDFLISGIYVTGANCTLRGFTVEGPGGVDATYVGPTSGILNSFYPGLIALVGVTTVDTPALMDCTVDGMRVINPGVAGISVYKAIGCNVTNNRVESDFPLASLFSKPQFFGIILYTTARHIVSGNTVNGFSQCVAVGGLGASYSFDDYAGTTSSKTRNFVINNNRLEACNDHAIYVTNDAEKYVIGDNYLWAASSTEDGAGGGSLKIEGGLFTVSNNVIRDGIVMRNCYECVISDNYVPVYSPIGAIGNGVIKAGLTHEEAAFQRPTTNVQISNNTFKVAGDIETTAGIWFFGRVADGYQSILSKISITGNTISGFGKDSGTFPGSSGIGYGIIVQQQLLTSGGVVVDIPGSAISISDNIVDMVPYTFGNGIYGIWLGWALDYCVVSNNLIQNVTQPGVFLAGARLSLFEGNLVEGLTASPPSIGFEERGNDLTIHVDNFRNTYGINQFSADINTRYFTVHPTTVVKDKISLVNAGAANSNQTVSKNSNLDNLLWSPTLAGLELQLSNAIPFSIGQTLNVINKGTESFTVRHPNGTTTNVITAGSSLNYICVGSNVFETFA